MEGRRCFEVNIREEKANTGLTQLGIRDEQLGIRDVRAVCVLSLTQRAQRHRVFQITEAS